MSATHNESMCRRDMWCGAVGEDDMANAADDGGLVFPTPGTLNPRGMTLREYYASLALQGLLAQSNGWSIPHDPNSAVELADALIAALGKVTP